MTINNGITKLKYIFWLFRNYCKSWILEGKYTYMYMYLHSELL